VKKAKFYMMLLCIESKKVKVKEAKSRMVVVRGAKWGPQPRVTNFS
jgi:hypothetical protein